MAKPVTTGTQLARECWTLLRQNGEWMKIPLLSAVGVSIVSVVFGIVSILSFGLLSPSSRGDSSGTTSVLGLVYLFLYYFVTYSIVIYSETALVSVVLMKLRGQKDNPVAADGFAVANQRIGAILGFAALSATVGMIARAISESGRNSKNLVAMILTAILASILQGAWTFMTLMVTPVIVAEKLGTFPAISRSWQLFKQTWGEQVVGRFSLGVFGCLMTLGTMVPGLLIMGLGGMIGSPIALVGGVVVLLIGIAVISLLTNAASGIFKAVLYQYATEGNTGGIFEESVVSQAFAPANS